MKHSLFMWYERCHPFPKQLLKQANCLILHQMSPLNPETEGQFCLNRNPAWYISKRDYGCELGLPAQGMPSETYASISILEELSAARQEGLSCKPVDLGGNPLDLHRELGYFETH